MDKLGRLEGSSAEVVGGDYVYDVDAVDWDDVYKVSVMLSPDIPHLPSLAYPVVPTQTAPVTEKILSDPMSLAEDL